MESLINTQCRRVFLYGEAVDMRVGFERLFYFIKNWDGKDFLKGDVYLFLGKNRTRAKVLVFDGTGLVLIIKRLERGRFQCLGDLQDRGELTAEEFAMILSGTHVNFSFSSMEEIAEEYFKKRKNNFVKSSQTEVNMS